MITAEHLRVRRSLMGANVKRRKPRAVPTAQQPRGVVVEYTRFLRSINTEIDDAIRAELVEANVLPRTNAVGPTTGPFTSAMLPGRAASIAVRLRAVADRILSRRSLLVALDGIAGRTSKFSGEQFSRQVKAAMGVDLVTGDPSMGALFDDFRARNLSLIRSLTTDKVERVEEVLQQAGTSTRAEDIAAKIQTETDASAARSALIARDQVLKLNSEVTAERHKAVGITQYIWRTSRDERVREAHRALDGTKQSYADPPVVDPRTGRRENPGQDYRCRCVADPVIPGFDD